MLRKIRDFIYTSAAAKTAVSLFCATGTGVFSNTLVTEMTTPDGIAWISFYKAISFYILLAFLGITYLFHRYMYVHETEIENFRDVEYCIAYARSQLIPVQIAVYKQKIRDGNTADIKAAMTELRRVLK